ncbi:DUF2255 family protein [Streptomyces sp. NPDC005799]|uniref:DUF2255 family protein n=1 Tax=Streptomyces sp. NPDC005799 TaxID=3154678 RepID=UPI0033F1A382
MSTAVWKSAWWSSTATCTSAPTGAVRSRWYRAARDEGHGRIEVAGVTHDVLLRTRDLALTPVLDDAFRAKYGTLADALVTSPEARAATIRIDPAPHTRKQTS